MIFTKFLHNNQINDFSSSSNPVDDPGLTFRCWLRARRIKYKLPHNREHKSRTRIVTALPALCLNVWACCCLPISLFKSRAWPQIALLIFPPYTNFLLQCRLHQTFFCRADDFQSLPRQWGLRNWFAITPNIGFFVPQTRPQTLNC